MGVVTAHAVRAAAIKPVKQRRDEKPAGTGIQTPLIRMQEKVLLRAEIEARPGETVAPRQGLVLALTAEHPVLVLLSGDVPLPLPLTVTVPAAQATVKAVLKYREKA